RGPLGGDKRCTGVYVRLPPLPPRWADCCGRGRIPPSPSWRVIGPPGKHDACGREPAESVEVSRLVSPGSLYLAVVCSRPLPGYPHGDAAGDPGCRFFGTVWWRRSPERRWLVAAAAVRAAGRVRTRRRARRSACPRTPRTARRTRPTARAAARASSP